MTIRIDSARLRLERKKRAWTQQHLAEASGLGIRTIQRIEKSEVASPESVQALASCFDLGVSDLITLPSKQDKAAGLGWIPRPALTVSILVVLALLSFASTRYATAKDVTLRFTTIVTAEDDRYEHIGQMSLDDGEESEFRMDGVFKVLITPRIIENSQVLIALKIFAVVNGSYALTSEPSLTTVNGKEAVFRLSLKDDLGSKVHVSVTPTM